MGFLLLSLHSSSYLDFSDSKRNHQNYNFHLIYLVKRKENLVRIVTQLCAQFLAYGGPEILHQYPKDYPYNHSNQFDRNEVKKASTLMQTVK